MSHSWAAKSAGAGGAAGATTKKDGSGEAAPVAAAAASDAAPGSPKTAAAASAAASAARSRLNYFLTFLRGSVVVAQLTDGSCIEGLFHTVDLQAAPTLVLHMAQRQLDSFAASEESPRVYENRDNTTAAPLPRNTTHGFEGSRKIALADLVHLSASALNPAEWTVEYAEWAAKHAAPSKASVSGGPRGFATDAAISGASDKQRELVKWSDDGDSTGATGLEWDAAPGRGSGGNNRHSSGGNSGSAFNQFETFERMTGKQSTFQFDDYSTPLDRNSKFYRENEARAEAIANSIQKSEAGSAHQMLEREGLEEGASRDRDADEGDLFSDVRRTVEAPNSSGKAGAYKPGAFGRQKQQAAGSTPSKQPSPDVVAGPAKPAQQPNSATKAPKPSPSPPAAGTAAAANGAPESAPGGVPATSVSPKPIDISLAAQQKAAVIAASPKEPSSSPAPVAAVPAAAEPAAASTAAAASPTPAPAAAASDAATSAAASSSAASSTSAPATTATPVKSSLSAKAKPFTLSAKAASFTPSAAPAAAAAAAVPAPVPAPMPLMNPGYMGAMGYPGSLPIFPGSPTGPGGVMPMMPGVGVGGGMMPGGAGMPFGMPGGQGVPPQMPQFSPQQLAQLTAQMMARGAPLPGVGGMPPPFFPPPPPPAVLPQGVNVNSPQFAMLQQQFMATMAANMAAAQAGVGVGAGAGGAPAFNPAMFNPALFQQMQQQQQQQQGGRQNPQQQPQFNPQQQQQLMAMAQQHAAAMARGQGQQQFQPQQQGNFRPQPF